MIPTRAVFETMKLVEKRQQNRKPSEAISKLSLS